MQRWSGITKLAVLAATAATLAAAAPHARAQDAYPARPIRIIVPSTPGGGSDVSARLIAQELSKRWGHSAVVENRAGAGTIVGTDLAAKAPPDGHTLLMAPGAFATNPSTYKKLPFDTVRDFAPISQAMSTPQLLVVHPSVPAKSVAAFIALARSRPGQVQYAAAGHGTLPHLSMELFANMARIRMVNVPYKGNTGLVDLLGGRIDASMSSSMAVALPHVRTGRLHALGVSAATRLAILPDVPSIAESGLPGYEALQWAGLLAPAGTPRDVVLKLHKETAAYLRRPDTVEFLARDGNIVVASSPDEFAAFIKAEITKWASVVKAAGITPE